MDAGGHDEEDDDIERESQMSRLPSKRAAPSAVDPASES